MSSQNKTLSWQAPEFKQYEKTAGWYATLIAVAVLVVGYFAIQRELFSAVTMVVVAAVIVYFSRQQPQLLTVTLNHRGIKFGTLFVPYKQIKHFWVVHNAHHKTLNIHTTAYLNHFLVFELEEQDPDEVRQFLLPYFQEHDEEHEALTQSIAHRFKF